MIDNKFTFKKKSGLGWYAFFLGLLACLFIYLDVYNPSFHRFRTRLSVIVLPVQYMIDFPIKMTHWIAGNISDREHLSKENAALRAKVFLLQANLQKQYMIESENAGLKALLQSSMMVHNKRKVLIAELLSVSSDPFTQQIVINQGENDGVFVGQPVLDAYGVMGQVVQAGELTSRVLLITNSQSAVPVQIKRNGIRAIVIGQGISNQIKLNDITNTTDVKPGDELITSGLGGCYPFGYPVGTVASVNLDAGGQFADITVVPAAHLNRSRLFLLIWSQKHHNHAVLLSKKNNPNAQTVRNNPSAFLNAEKSSDNTDNLISG